MRALAASTSAPAALDEAGALDDSAALDEAAARGEVPAAEMEAADGRLAMRLFTSYPGLQVYSGNHLGSVAGRDGRPFAPHAGLALEPQFFPDAPNHPHLGPCVLRPGEEYRSITLLEFGVGEPPAMD